MEERLPIFNVERLFNQAVHELEEDVRPGSVEGLIIFKKRHRQFSGWIEKYLLSGPVPKKGKLEKPNGDNECDSECDDIPVVTARDVLENIKYVILGDLIGMHSNIKQIEELKDEDIVQ